MKKQYVEPVLTKAGALSAQTAGNVFSGKVGGGAGDGDAEADAD